MKEPELKTILARRLLDHGCQVFNRVMALELIVKNGRVAGAVGINIRTGELVVCHAGRSLSPRAARPVSACPTTVTSRGCTIFPATPETAYAMAYRAGAL